MYVHQCTLDLNKLRLQLKNNVCANGTKMRNCTQHSYNSRTSSIGHFNHDFKDYEITKWKEKSHWEVYRLCALSMWWTVFDFLNMPHDHNTLVNYIIQTYHNVYYINTLPWCLFVLWTNRRSNIRYIQN